MDIYKPKKNPIFERMGFRLEQTCRWAPEQYNVFDGNNNQVGYIRIRHGFLSVYYPNLDGYCIYESKIKGDSELEDDERDCFLDKCLKKIKKEAKNE